MKKLFLILLLPFLAVACKNVDTEAWKEYQNERYGFALKYPEYLEEHPLEVGLSDEVYQLSFMTPGDCEDCELIEGTDSPADKLELNILYLSVEDYLSAPQAEYKELEMEGYSVWLSEPWIGLKANVREALVQLSEDRTLQILTQGDEMNEALKTIVETLQVL